MCGIRSRRGWWWAVSEERAVPPVPEEEWFEVLPPVVDERSGRYVPDAMVDYLPNLHCRFHSQQ